MAANHFAWHKYVYEGFGFWWWCETDGDCFLESNPGPWAKYSDPMSARQYWWRDDTNWFWIDGVHGQVGHSLNVNRAVKEEQVVEPNLVSTPELLTVKQQESQPEQALRTQQVNACGTQARWTCTICDEVNKAGRSQCNCCGAQAGTNVKSSERFVEDASVPPTPLSAPDSIAVAKPHQLPLLGDCSSAGVTWQYPLRDEMQQSYVGHLRECISSKDAKSYLRIIMDSMDELGWDRPPSDKRSGCSGGGGAKRGVIGRHTKWLVRAGCCCTYRHNTVTARDLPATPFPSWMNAIMKACMPLCGLAEPSTWPNSCIINKYTDGSEAIDWHCDDESLFGGISDTGERIITLVLGSERPYELRPSDTPTYAENVPLSCSLLVKGGDIFSMEGRTPKYYMHRMPKYAGKKGERVGMHLSLTWRWIVAHGSKNCLPQSQQ